MSMLNRFWLIQRRSGVPVKSSLTDIQGDSKWQNSIDRTRLPILVCHCRYSSIYHFRDTKIRLIGRKSAPVPVSFEVLSRGFIWDLGYENWSHCATRRWKLRDPMSICVHVVPACGGQTDRQTDKWHRVC